jgi:hypothetical protein
MYLVLVTNKASNILEDLETLRLLGKVVPEYVMPLEEELIAEAAFDLIFAFDEVISQGYKENVTIAQVKQNTEMESHEEKLHKMIIQSKINETKDQMKKKAIEIDRTRMEGGRAGGMGAGGGRTPTSYTAPGGGFGGGMGGGGGGSMDAFARPDGPGLSFGGGSSRAEPVSNRIQKKGMQLGGGKKAGQNFLESLKAEGESVEDVHHGTTGPFPGAPHPPPLPSEPVFVSIEEKLSAVLNKDGGVEGIEIQGNMSLTVTSPDVDGRLRLKLSHPRGGSTEGYQFKTHPNIDKSMHAEQDVLGLKDPSRPFPTGAPLGVLKWRLQSQDESLLPITINAWPSVSGSDSYVNIEYESVAEFDLQHVTVVIPLPALASAPQVNQIDGDWKYDARKSALIWTIEIVDDSNRSGALEFVVPAADPNMFFPVEVSFNATSTLCDVGVAGIVSAETGEPIAKYGSSTSLVTDDYRVE